MLVPVPEYRFHPKRKWRFDYAWPEQKVALEIEGGIWTLGRHTRGAGFRADMEKYNEAGRAGWRVFRFTPDRFKTGEAHQFMKEVFAQDAAACELSAKGPGWGDGHPPGRSRADRPIQRAGRHRG